MKCLTHLFRLIAGALVCALALSASAGWAAEMVVENVQFEGNIKTKSVILSQELPYKPGDTVTAEDLEAGTQAIKDLGLFESVEHSTTEIDSNTVVVTYKVVEKRFNFILPKLNRNGDGDITTGVVWRSDNLFGLNQTSKFTVAYKKFDDSDEESVFSFCDEYTSRGTASVRRLCAGTSLAQSSTQKKAIPRRDSLFSVRRPEGPTQDQVEANQAFLPTFSLIRAALPVRPRR